MFGYRRTVLAWVVVCLLVSPAAPQPPPDQPAAAGAGVDKEGSDVGKGAEEVAARLRDLARSLTDTTEIAALEAEVATYAHRVADTWDETGRLLERNLRTTALDSLAT